VLYTSFFGLNEEPFGVTPDPKFLYPSPKHEEAIATLTYGITNNRGFILFTGAVGSGKTTVLRHVFYHLGPDVHTAMVLNPRMNARELLQFINYDFGLKVKRNSTPKTLMDDLNAFLIGCHKAGEKAVLAVDESQEMSPECLEFIRLISNLETDTAKLIQIILVGQPELRNIVGSTRLRQLDQRIAIRYHLDPLDEAETAHYIRHRLKVAGSSTIDFPASGVKAIHSFSRGVPRLINLACDRVLLASFAHEEIRIRPNRVKEIMREFEREDVRGDEMTREGKPVAAKRRSGVKTALAVAAMTLYVAILAFVGVTKGPAIAASLKARFASFAVSAGLMPAPVAASTDTNTFMEDGIYMASSPGFARDAGLKNLLSAWGERDLGTNAGADLMRDRDYGLYELGSPDDIGTFDLPALLDLGEQADTRYVTLRWKLGDYVQILDPTDGKKVVPFSWVKENAVRAMVIYRRGEQAGEMDDASLNALLSAEDSRPSLIP